MMTNSDHEQQQQQQQQAATTTPTTTTNDQQAQCLVCQRLQAELGQAREELGQWRGRCLAAERDNGRLHNELRCLEREMEEMHDNFKEEESEQFEQVKQELDAAVKNCKILQIRLSKSERQYHQLEQIKTMLERQLEDAHANQQQANQQKLDQQSEQSINKPMSGGQQQPQPQPAAAFAQLGPDYVKLATQEYDQLLRDLNDTIERERDLQEQIKYSQEEVQLKGDRLQAIELENEILLSKINKLTLVNSRLRSTAAAATSAASKPGDATSEAATGTRGAAHSDTTTTAAAAAARSSPTSPGGAPEGDGDRVAELRDLLEQSEQLKLALEVAQSENTKFKGKVRELASALDSKEKQAGQLEAQLAELRKLQHELKTTTDGGGSTQVSGQQPAEAHKLELECRQLRSRLVQSERECRQLKAQLELFCGGGGVGVGSARQAPRAGQLGLAARSQSVESAGGHPSAGAPGGDWPSCRSSGCQASQRQLEEQCASLRARNADLERRLQRLDGGGGQQAGGSSPAAGQLESDLLEKLKRQLDKSESELAKARSRLVELDLECGRAQRQYKRLLASLESCGGGGGGLDAPGWSARKSRLPADESTREAMSRQELRQAIRDLEGDLDEMLAVVRAKEVLVRELRGNSTPPEGDNRPSAQQEGAAAAAAAASTEREQVKSLRRLIDQERLLSDNLKLDVASLEQAKNELDRQRRMLERERGAMEEELDRLHQVNGELRCELEASEAAKAEAQSKSRELSESLERVRLELRHQREQQQQQQLSTVAPLDKGGQQTPAAAASAPPGPSDLLLMARDLSELKVKNGFLMRQLEMAREDAARQLEEARESHEIKLKRAVELGQLEVRERHLGETQQLRDELSELKQRLAAVQRQCQRHEEETGQERDRLRCLERDWRRDRSQWQQQREQLEGQLAIERRSSEFKFKESESQLRDRERALLALQDRCVQLERDLKRTQNKYQLLEEDCESRVKGLSKELEAKTREHSELLARWRQTEGDFYATNRRLQEERATLSETLARLRQGYDEKLAELKKSKELHRLRQEQALREARAQQERVEALIKRCNELMEQETQNKLLRQRLELLERQLEAHRRDLLQLREERARLRARCDELEKRELIAKTHTISPHGASSGGSGGSSFLKPFIGQASGSSSSSVAAAAGKQSSHQSTKPSGGATAESASTIERLSGKINDQRHLIEMLRQQLNENQLELKQLKLMQSSERFKWQARVSLLQSRLNELEEKLAFETALYEANPELLDQLARPRMDQNWAHERQSSQDLIQQQSGQIELLSRDLKKVSQAHDLLRLHAKQLESYNNKLAKKLIEYQQQPPPLPKQQHLYSETDRQQRPGNSAKLTRDLAPLVAIVNKIVASLDAPDQQQPPQQVQSPQQLNGRSAANSSSTNRPLQAPQSRGASQESDTSLAASELQQQQQQRSVASISTPPPAHQLAAAASDRGQHQSRLARLFVGGRPGSSSSSSRLDGSAERTPTAAAASDFGGPAETSRAAAAGKKPVKRVRIKCSSLGITTSEKKQLKLHLQALASELDLATGQQQQQQQQTSPSPAVGSRATRQPDGRTSTASVASDATAASGRGVRWQVDSDLESERSWSAEPAAAAASTKSSSNSYRRFPQATPSSSRTLAADSGGGGGGDGGPRGASLTDYESESSLASDFSISSSAVGAAGASTRRLGGAGGVGGGAESDSGLTSATSLSGRKRASRGLKSRLTSTLRSLSRSIQAGLGSDSETTTSEPATNPRSKAAASRRGTSQEAQAADSTRRAAELREIRV